VISVASNIIPSEVQQLVESFRRGDFANASAIHQRFYPLFRDLFIEPNPVPIKTALAAQKACEEDVRLPLCEMNQSNKELLFKTLNSIGIK